MNIKEVELKKKTIARNRLKIREEKIDFVTITKRRKID